jgi:hypothetical protein
MWARQGVSSMDAKLNRSPGQSLAGRGRRVKPGSRTRVQTAVGLDSQALASRLETLDLTIA